MATSFQTQILSVLGNKTKYLMELKKTFARPLIQLAVRDIKLEHIEEGILERISKKYNIPEDDIDEYYAAILAILKTHFRLQCHTIKPTEFKQCLEELKLAPDCIEDLSSVIYGPKQSDLLSGLIQRTKFNPQLISCRWRVDIIISSNILNRVLEPNVIMEWIFNTGECIIFELSLAKFHQLRHTIATILVELQTLERHSIFKTIHSS
ncbi:COMM domain-containing protein 5-like [Odontomachus brunneus]|uniref:COMM domain-containing protein 5-like n=1 Tax=Odontomachus brunneus TaxID=486640 RepID=UPI0013F1968D|nr:COMM domain-containing protein 5-like [Odontomachus brunneus]XP_032687425.1 COMM domain-containing protein 5-like [Odontomachus brunneus]